MNKYKIVVIVFVSVLVIIFISLTLHTSVSRRQSFSVKAVDILPTLPVPKPVAVSGALKSSSSEIVFVPRVIDGDTIVVEPVDSSTGEPGKQQTVRYIGMDTPETVSPTKPVECGGHEASARNKELVDGNYVAIAKDVTDKDTYGRLLRFVYLVSDASGTIPAGTLVNLELVKEGYARVLTIPPNTEFANEFNIAASSAQAEKLGFWGECTMYPFTN